MLFKCHVFYFHHCYHHLHHRHHPYYHHHHYIIIIIIIIIINWYSQWHCLLWWLVGDQSQSSSHTLHLLQNTRTWAGSSTFQQKSCLLSQSSPSYHQSNLGDKKHKKIKLLKTYSILRVNQHTYEIYIGRGKNEMPVIMPKYRYYNSLKKLGKLP